MRIGHGFDVHAFGPGDAVTLGGVRIAHSHGVRAHSDGDVLVHALCDALLGAAGLGDIGEHFPDSDPAYAGADSIELLRQVATRLRKHQFAIANVDLTLVAEGPRVSAHKAAMCERIAAALGIEPTRVNVKATTTEGLGYLGRQEGIAAHAVVLLNEAGD